MATNRIVPKILVAGRTGAGKSSLLNAILGKEAFRTGIRPTTMGFDVQTWASQWGEVEVIDSRGFAEADSTVTVASGDSVIQKGYEEAHVCLLVIPAANRDLERESRWVADAKKHGLFQVVPIFLIVSRLDEVAPIREWNPESLNLESPTTAKEINIRGKLDYLKSLSAFAEFFNQNRVVPVSAGQSDGADGAFNTAPFGIQILQDRIFQVLPEAAKVEYARMARRFELVKISTQKLVAGYIGNHIAYGVILSPLSLCFGVGTFIVLLGSLIGHLVGFNPDVSSLVVVEYFMALFFSLIIPMYLEYRMVKKIAARHGFNDLSLGNLLSLFHRYPRLLAYLDFEEVGAGKILAAFLGALCCIPVGIGIFLTRPIAESFNEIFYQLRLSKSMEGVSLCFNGEVVHFIPPELASMPRWYYVGRQIKRRITEFCLRASLATRRKPHPANIGSAQTKTRSVPPPLKSVGSVEERLQTLNGLLAKNLISQADYEVKKKKILGSL